MKVSIVSNNQISYLSFKYLYNNNLIKHLFYNNHLIKCIFCKNGL